MDPLTREQRRRNMQANKSSGTKTEVVLAKALWQRGHRYRRNYKKIAGKPDIVFVKLKIAIFCDGEFWHGKDWKKKRAKIVANRNYWVEKIERNIRRDKQINRLLRKQGWIVLRFWHNEIKKNINNCINIVESVIFEKNKHQ